MNSKTSIVGMLVVSAALLGAASSASATVHTQTALSASAGLSVDSMAFRGSPSAMGASISTAAISAGTGAAVGSSSNASAMGAAAATREEALPASNLAMLLLAALAAMGSIVIRRSGNR